jgi:hypothetical protein
MGNTQAAVAGRFVSGGYATPPSGDARHIPFTGTESAMADKPLSEEQRKEIFLALVDAQDHDMSVTQSRRHIAAQFGIREEQVRRIEQEGIENGWPPL